MIRDGDFPLSCWCCKHKTVQNLKWRREILFSRYAVHGRQHTFLNCATFADEETWFKLIETASRM